MTSPPLLFHIFYTLQQHYHEIRINGFSQIPNPTTRLPQNPTKTPPSSFLSHHLQSKREAKTTFVEGKEVIH
jgi:hypothetical protein